MRVVWGQLAALQWWCCVRLLVLVVLHVFRVLVMMYVGCRNMAGESLCAHHLLVDLYL